MQKTVIVTGGSSGIGAATCRLLAAEGANVVVNYRANKEEADGVVAACTKLGGKAVAVKGDMSEEADIINLFKECDKAFGPLTGLEASVATPKGTIEVTYKRSGESLTGTVTLPHDVSGTFVWKGKETPLKTGTQKIEF